LINHSEWSPTSDFQVHAHENISNVIASTPWMVHGDSTVVVSGSALAVFPGDDTGSTARAVQPESLMVAFDLPGKKAVQKKRWRA
jgi:hypothetical protein